MHSKAAEYDAVIVGASLAGCTAAILLGREGARVALVEKQPDPNSFKRLCSHYIQASAVPTLERLGLLDRILAAGGLLTPARIWTPGGWIQGPPREASQGVNLRRERLDPLVREIAAETPGVDLLLGQTVEQLVLAGEIGGVIARDRDGGESVLRARLTIGADGRESRIAELAGVRTRTRPHGRFAYAAYFENPRKDEAVSSLWLLDPQVGAEFPTDDGLVLYVAMLTKDRLPEFKRDPKEALISHVASLPDAPPIRDAAWVGPMLGKLEMPNRSRDPAAPGLALIGDAALAVDPLFGIGCGWAFQSGEWLADSVASALRGTEPLRRGLARYKRKHRHELRGHTFIINDYATGRRMRPGERMMMGAAARDEKLAVAVEEFGTRRIKPSQMFARVLPRAIALQARALAGRRAANER
jgi:menaquinone-9 beta-reductase